MKRILQISVLSILSFAVTVAGMPAQAAVHYDHRDYRNNAGYREVPTYGPAYYGHYDGDGYAYYNRDRDAERSAAIVAGSAAAGAVIGAAAGHGEGAAVGAVIGGVAGLIANEAVQHHDRR